MEPLIQALSGQLVLLWLLLLFLLQILYRTGLHYRQLVLKDPIVYQLTPGRLRPLYCILVFTGIESKGNNGAAVRYNIPPGTYLWLSQVANVGKTIRQVLDSNQERPNVWYTTLSQSHLNLNKCPQIRNVLENVKFRVGFLQLRR